MIEKKNLDKLLQLDDEELRKKIDGAANAVGANSAQLKYALSDIDRIRNMISGLTESDIQNLIDTYGKDNAKKVSDILKSED